MDEVRKIMAEFPHWQLWRHVSRPWLWYARRPRSSPPIVVGPVPLAKLLDAIADAEVQR